MNNFLWGVLSIGLISLISLVGVGGLAINKNLIKRITFLLISLAAGTLIGDVFLHILPEIAESGAEWSWGGVVIVGILAFFLLEKLLSWHHHHHVDQSEEECDHSVGWINLAADGLHNFVDGLILAAAFSTSLELGIATTIAVMLHEIPQELGDFGVLMHAGFSRGRALAYNFVSALMAVAGFMLAYAVSSFMETADYLMAFAAGGFIYIAVADLLPELSKDKRWKVGLLQLTTVLIGVGIMWLLTFWE